MTGCFVIARADDRGDYGDLDPLPKKSRRQLARFWLARDVIVIAREAAQADDRGDLKSQRLRSLRQLACLWLARDDRKDLAGRILSRPKGSQAPEYASSLVSAV